MEILEVRETWIAATETTQVEVVEVGVIPVNTGGVTSINGKTGVLTTEDVLEWATNEW